MAGGTGNVMVKLSMFGWIPVVLGIFRKLPPRTAAAVSFCSAWMFLPVAAFPLKGLPDYTKTTATCFGILLAAYLFDRKCLSLLRPHLLDLPMVLWCACPLLSSVSNGLGVYDGLSESMYQTVSWGLPYLVGRLYFAQEEGRNVLARVVILGGVIYVPLCWIEMILSPQLHRMLYGFHQHSFLQTIRGNGFRPMVFMEHGLMTAMWMVTASMLGIWLYSRGLLPRKVLRIPTLPVLLFLFLTTCLLRSMGALALLLLGLAGLYVTSLLRTRLLLVLLMLLPPAYMAARVKGGWSGENLTRPLERLNAERAQSLQFRLDNENILIDKALMGGLFGWGGWGRSRVYDDKGKDISVTDGLWIITLGTRGPYGLTLLTLVVILPALMTLIRLRGQALRAPQAAAPLALAMIMVIYMIDNIPNAMVNPVFMLFNGSLMGGAMLPASMHMVPTPVQPQTQAVAGGTRFLGAPSGRAVPVRFLCQRQTGSTVAQRSSL